MVAANCLSNTDAGADDGDNDEYAHAPWCMHVCMVGVAQLLQGPGPTMGCPVPSLLSSFSSCDIMLAFFSCAAHSTKAHTDAAALLMLAIFSRTAQHAHGTRARPSSAVGPPAT